MVIGVGQRLALGCAALAVAAASVYSVAAAGDTFAKKSKAKSKSSARPSATDSTLGLERSPYLQSLGTDSVLVAWNTTRAGDAFVDYGVSQAYGASVQAVSDGERHVATLRGLAPGTTYYYRVRAGGAVLAGGPEHTFRTDAGRSDDTFYFFATADIGAKGGKQDVTGRDILATAPLAEFGLLSGDIVYNRGASEHYDKRLMQPWANLLHRMPVWPALGNHDWKSRPETNWRVEWYLPHNEHYYSFDYANAHFIALDTRDGEIYDRDAQVAWLRADLEKHKDADWKFVFFHHPGITCTYKGDNEAVIAHLLPLFDRYRVDVVFTGHAHTYERLYPIRNGRPVHIDQDPHYMDPDGTLYIVSGAGGKVKKGMPTRSCGPTAFFKDETILWTHVSVEGPTCTIRTYRSADHALIDTASVTKSRLGGPPAP